MSAVSKPEETPVCYVVQDDPTKNVIPAMKFGSIVVVLEQGTQITFAAAPYIRKMRTVMNKFRPQDYVICIGDPAAIGIACAIAAEKTGGSFNILKWDRQERRYYPIRVELNGPTQ